MAHTGIVRRKQDHNKQTWEETDFPILCEECLGENPYLRMTKETFGKECKTCSRPFTVFRWRPGARARYKKTEICTVCAKLKNVCQSCVLDLQFGLPVQLRDQALPNSVQIPESEANREFFLDQADTMISICQTERETTTPDQMLTNLKQSAPNYKRNLSKICEFYLQGKCTRGKECPYRHDEADQSGNIIQNIKNRYHGINDPLAKKIINRLSNKLEAPQDTTITTLYIGGIKNSITEDDIRNNFNCFGDIKCIQVIPKLESAYITFENRDDAEKAADSLFKKLKIKDIPLSLSWGKSSSVIPPLITSGNQNQNIIAPLPPGMPTLTVSPFQSMFATTEQYPSMDNTVLGTKGDN